MVHATHVEYIDGRQRAAVDPVRQAQPRQRHDALRARGGAAGQQHRAVLLGPALGHRASVVARIALVLVRAVVLLVDDDQPDVGQRREHGRARSHADPRLAAAQTKPLLLALALAEPGVQHRHDVPEARLEAAHRLRRERDLRHQHDRAPAGGQRGLHGLEVHLGLARPGHPVEQEAPGGWLAAPQPGEHSVERPALLVGQGRDPVQPASHRHRRRSGRASQRAQLDQAARLETAQRTGPERGGQHLSVALQDGQRGPLPIGQPLLALQRPRPGFGERRDQHRLGPGTAGGSGREHERERPGRRRAVLLGDPPGQPDQVGRDPGRKHRVGLGQPLGGQRRLRGKLEHDPERGLPAERHPQHGADVHFALLGPQPVVERTAHRTGAGERLDAGDQWAGTGKVGVHGGIGG